MHFSEFLSLACSSVVQILQAESTVVCVLLAPSMDVLDKARSPARLCGAQVSQKVEQTKKWKNNLKPQVRKKVPVWGHGWLRGPKQGPYLWQLFSKPSHLLTKTELTAQAFR